MMGDKTPRRTEVANENPNNTGFRAVELKATRCLSKKHCKKKQQSESNPIHCDANLSTMSSLHRCEAQTDRRKHRGRSLPRLGSQDSPLQKN